MREPPQIAPCRMGAGISTTGRSISIIEAFGERDAVEAAYARAARRFTTILDELCAELPLLRTPATPASPRPRASSRGAWPPPLRLSARIAS